MSEIEDQLIQKYENLLLKAQKYKIPEREATFFDFALRKYHENPTTELLSFFLDPNEVHGLDDTFYRGLVETIQTEFRPHDFGNFQDLAIEQVTNDNKRIDLWLETDTSLIIIEAKIDHQQINPVKSYQSWAKEKTKSTNKDIIKLVLNVDGQSDFKDWSAISFNTLAMHVRHFLAKQSLINPFNKWFILAREFLLHLENYNEIVETDMDIVNFVIGQYNDIQKLFELREQANQEIKNHILNHLHFSFEGLTFKVIQEQRYKKDCKGWRFVKEGVNANSDIVLYVHYEQNPMVEVWLCFDTENKEKSIAGKISSKLKRSKDKFNEYINWTKSDESTKTVENCRSICWEFKSFDLHQITDVLIEAQKVLNEFE